MSLINILINLIKVFFPSYSIKCEHSKIRPDIDQCYCPDCGKLIKNEWFIARCSSCGVKMKAMVKNGCIISQEHYCSNCGSSEYSVEKIEKINFIDINFAALIKTEIEEEHVCSTTKCWQEKINEQPKLLVQYL